MTPSLFTKRELARCARGQAEEALDRIRWRWSPRLSLLLDLWLIVEESDDA